MKHRAKSWLTASYITCRFFKLDELDHVGMRKFKMKKHEKRKCVFTETLSNGNRSEVFIQAGGDNRYGYHMGYQARYFILAFILIFTPYFLSRLCDILLPIYDSLSQLTFAIIDFSSVDNNGKRSEEHSQENFKEHSQEYSEEHSRHLSNRQSEGLIQDDIFVIFFHGSPGNVPQACSSSLIGLLHIGQDVTYVRFGHENENENKIVNRNVSDCGNKDNYDINNIDNKSHNFHDKNVLMKSNDESRKENINYQIKSSGEKTGGGLEGEEEIKDNDRMISVMEIINSIMKKQFSSSPLESSILIKTVILMPVDSVWGKEAEDFYVFVKV